MVYGTREQETGSRKQEVEGSILDLVAIKLVSLVRICGKEIVLVSGHQYGWNTQKDICHCKWSFNIKV